MAEKFWSIAELAVASNRSIGRLHQLIAQGVIPYFQIGKQFVVREQAAKEFIKRCREIDGHENRSLPGLDSNGEAA